MRKNQTEPIHHNQQGFASMVVALILILILSLLTVGFAQIARREQQNALDKQLANQANYAAESAINDALIDIKNGKITTANNHSGTDCITPTDVGVGAQTHDHDVDAAYGVSYSCLIVNLDLPNLVKQPLASDQAWSIAFNTSAPLSNLTINWTSHSTGKTRQPSPYATTGFTPPPNWGNHPAVLQFSITPISLGSDRTSMTNNTFTAFLYPAGGGGSAVYAAGNSTNNAPVVNGNCTNVVDTKCSATITGISGGTGPYLVHILDYYDTSELTMTGTDALASPVDFEDGQAQVDATGKAKNVLKRLQARVPLNGLNDALPSYAIEAQNLCKRFKTAPTDATNNPLGTAFDTAVDPGNCSLFP